MLAFLAKNAILSSQTVYFAPPTLSPDGTSRKDLNFADFSTMSLEMLGISLDY